MESLNSNTLEKNICFNITHKYYDVNITRDKKRHQKVFDNLEAAITWRDYMLKRLGK